MTRLLRCATIAICALPFARVAARAQSPNTLVVELGDVDSGQPLERAQVTVPELLETRRADALGVTRFVRVPPGIVHVQARMIGYDAMDTPVAIGGSDTTEVVMLLRRTTQKLAAVAVRSSATQEQLQDFERRRERGVGHFLTDSSLGNQNGQNVERALAARLPGLQVVWNESEHLYMFATNRGSQISAPVWQTDSASAASMKTMDQKHDGTAELKQQQNNGTPQQGTAPGHWQYNSTPCWIDVYINGIRLTAPDVDQLKSLTIVGVEYYRAEETPVELRRPGVECGALLLWTR